MSRLRHQIQAFPGGPVGWLGLGGRHAGAPARTAMVLVHGFAGNVLTWQLNLGALAAHRPVIALDLPAHGRSTPCVGGGTIPELAAWLLRALDAIGLECPCHFVGHSLGGWVALTLALAHPDRVRSLTLISCGGLSRHFDLGFLRRLLAATSVEEARGCVRALFATPPSNLDAFARALQVAVADPAARAGLATIVERAFVPGLAATPRVPWDTLRMPLQVVWGDADTVIPLPAAHRLPAAAVLHRLDGVGHLPHLEAVARVNALLNAFAGGCEDGGGP